MSFVFTAPEVVTAAAGNLAGIGSALQQAITAAAGPTSSVAAAAADEVSSAISQLFGGYGKEFQSLSAQSAVFHAEFVKLLNSTAAAYLDTEVANAAHTADSILPFSIIGIGPVGSGSGGGGLGGLLGGLGSILGFGTSSGGNSAPAPNPYQALFTNTGANLQTIAGAWAANPFPALHQIVINQTGYAQLVVNTGVYAVLDFPAGLQVLPGQFAAAIQSATGFNPVSFAQWFGARQAGYGQIVTTSLATAVQDLQTRIPVFEQDLGTAGQDLVTGDYHGAVAAIPRAFLDLFLSGVDISNLSTVEVQGPAGDLLPILNVLADEEQDFINLLPLGSTVQHIAQNASAAINAIAAPLGYAIIGPPIAGLDGLATGATVLGTAVQTGNVAGVVGALVDMPAYGLNGFLNGQTVVNLTIPVSETLNLPGLPPIGPNTPVVVHVPFDGILVQPQPITATIDVSEAGVTVDVVTISYGGTQFGGLVPELLTYIPEQVAAAISGSGQQSSGITFSY